MNCLEKGEIELELSSLYQNLGIIRRVIRNYLELEGLTKLDEVQIISVIDELSTNVVEHAYNGGSEDGVIKIMIKHHNETIEISVEDFGVGFDGEKNSSKEEGGLGLNIVKGATESFKCIKKENGTKIEVIKRVNKEVG